MPKWYGDWKMAEVKIKSEEPVESKNESKDEHDTESDSRNADAKAKEDRLDSGVVTTPLGPTTCASSESPPRGHERNTSLSH